MIDFLSFDFGKTWAVASWEDGKCIEVTSFEYDAKPMWQNIKDFYDFVENSIQNNRCKIVVEKSHSKFPHQWMQYLEVKYICQKYKIVLIEYKTQTIKKISTGKGNASKETVMDAVAELDYVLCSPEGEHENDSIACGVCYLLS